MHATDLIHANLGVACQSIHRTRFNALLTATAAALDGQTTSVTGLGNNKGQALLILLLGYSRNTDRPNTPFPQFSISRARNYRQPLIYPRYPLPTYARQAQTILGI
ncbi:hypothetical protein [Ectothiorhodospira sp. BSL-9]|uniref:hypothetical protein n=1 Tax=Ectothiorhodospira sp. BSL-9 TaxID=1442136 RepID=UPI0007B430A0|nr:hypothetical protein [Ectothiorhodospira sp. BSL-9]ANB02144.1 hypothetical protein ECTOBSL9_1449 [Ectothiorhodospira sp. BSL-9]